MTPTPLGWFPLGMPIVAEPGATPEYLYRRADGTTFVGDRHGSLYLKEYEPCDGDGQQPPPDGMVMYVEAYAECIGWRAR